MRSTSVWPAVVVAVVLACHDRPAVTTAAPPPAAPPPAANAEASAATATRATTGTPVPPPAPPAVVHRVGGDVLAPVVMERVAPRITEEMRCRGLVVAEAIIDATGQVREARDVTPSPDAFTGAHVEAIRSWRFRPATRNGQPVAVVYSITVQNRCG